MKCTKSKYSISKFLNKKKNYSSVEIFCYCNVFSRFIVKFSFLFVVIANFSPTIAQNKKGKLQIKVELGEAQNIIPTNKSEEEITRECLINARINAIENAFGEVILQGNSTYIRNSQNGKQSEVNQVFNFIGESYVNGEWMEDIEPPLITKFNHENERWIKVKVKCKVRELDVSVPQFQAEPLSCTKIICATETFNNGQDLYLHFKTPEKGYLAIYLDVPEDRRTYRLFPYKNFSKDSLQQLKADEDYIFFSSKNSKICSPAIVDELILTLKDPAKAEFNKMYIIFTPNQPTQKPLLSKGSAINFTTEEWKLELPDFLNSESFQKWLITNRINNEKIQVKYVYLSINPKSNDK